MEYEDMRKLEKTHVCAVCGADPVTVWDSENDHHRLACGKDKTHNGFKRRPTATQRIAQGRADEVAGKGAQKELEVLARKYPERFSLLPRKDIETGAALSPADITDLDAYARSVGLDVYLGHVGLYFGEPRVTVDGYYYLAKTQGRDVSVCALPATAQDYESYKVPKDDYFFIARGWVDGKEVHEVGLGIVTQAEIAEMSKKHTDQKRFPIAAKYPQRVAEKRAEWQLQRKLIPLEVKT